MVRTLPIFFAAIALFAFLSPNVSYAQERCGIVEYEKQRNANKKNPETEQAFEQWMQQKLSEGRLKTFQTGKTQSFSGTIPVVVHVIHNGEPVGTGTNVSDAQILSQIQVLNEDYKRLNADANQTPAEFGSVAGSIDLQFVLAKQDPEGLPTNGIVRVRGTQSSWDALSENNIFKALSYWPAEDYLNIWVLNLTGSFIGYAQLPISTLAGLEGSSTDRLTDGVSVDYQAFGSGSSFNLLPQYNKGRTATHEIGHFFGLRHIWGDGNCATDYVDDTPFQTSSTNGCPSHPQASCDAPAKPNKMFQNYLDDTNDVCMNLFTQGQVARMIVVLQNSIRRISLLNSPGATAPVVVTNDLGIRQIVSPSSTLCNTSITPRIEVRNYGSNTVTSSQIQLTVNGVVAEARTFSGLSLAPEASTTVSFNDVTITSSNPVFAFQILQTNGLVDGKPSNNSASITVTIIPSSSLPIIEPFNATPPGWQIINPDGNITWANVVAPDNSVTNRAMYMNFHAYENEGTLDWLITPAFPLVNPSGSQLKFDLAYAQFPGEAGDGLKVYALRGCNTDLSQAILLYDKTSTALATAASTSNSFVPSSESQWRKSEVISLDGLTGATNWQLAFVARNGYGNNLFIDNAIVSDQVINDLALTSILQPGLVHCVQNPVIQFTIKNFSTVPVTSFQMQYSLNGGAVVRQDFNNVQLALGEQKNFNLNAVSLNPGNNPITLSVNNPNGLPDSSPSNNTLAFNSYLDRSTDATPLRVTFDNPQEKPWIIASPPSAATWQSVATNKRQSIVYTGFTNTRKGDEAWFVSPVLDLTRYQKHSLFFDESYALNAPATERLKILGSDDCGLTYKTVLYDREGTEFSITNSSSAWTPSVLTDWRRSYVRLDTMSGKSNVRLAFVVTNQNGNNLYLDNLEIFAGSDINPPVTSVPYQLYYSSRDLQSDVALTFNLPEKKDVRLQVYSLMGQLIADNILPATLNQTYYFDLSNQPTGIYLFRLQIDNQITATKVFIGH